METLDSVRSILDAPITTFEKALQLFDTLDPVPVDFMIGRWKGAGLHTSHPMDGLLEASNWYGKEFIDAETVHPLLFLDFRGNLIKVRPHPIAMKLALNVPIFKQDVMKPVLRLTNMLLKTERSQARLRMMEYRNQVSATMIYDALPINDSFRKVDEDTVLGAMDFKGSPQPFFFVLKRGSRE